MLIAQNLYLLGRIKELEDRVRDLENRQVYENGVPQATYNNFMRQQPQN